MGATPFALKVKETLRFKGQGRKALGIDGQGNLGERKGGEGGSQRQYKHVTKIMQTDPKGKKGFWSGFGAGLVRRRCALLCQMVNLYQKKCFFPWACVSEARFINTGSVKCPTVHSRSGVTLLLVIPGHRHSNLTGPSFTRLSGRLRPSTSMIERIGKR